MTPNQIIESTNWSKYKNNYNNPKQLAISKAIKHKCKTTHSPSFKHQSAHNNSRSKSPPKHCARKFISTKTIHRNKTSDHKKGKTTPRFSKRKERPIIWQYWKKSYKWSMMKIAIMKRCWRKLNHKISRSWWKGKKKGAFMKYFTPKII